jgi:hypothetical protein
MKHSNTPKAHDIQDITEHFALHGAPIVPSTDKLFGDGGKDTWDDLPLAPIQDVPEPAISMVDIAHYSAIALNGMGIFYIGTLIGNAIAYLLR